MVTNMTQVTLWVPKTIQTELYDILDSYEITQVKAINFLFKRIIESQDLSISSEANDIENSTYLITRIDAELLEKIDSAIDNRSLLLREAFIRYKDEIKTLVKGKEREIVERNYFFPDSFKKYFSSLKKHAGSIVMRNNIDYFLRNIDSGEIQFKNLYINEKYKRDYRKKVRLYADQYEGLNYVAESLNKLNHLDLIGNDILCYIIEKEINKEGM